MDQDSTSHGCRPQPRRLLWGPSPLLAQKGVGAHLPNFRPILLWPNGWMHQGATWYGGRPQPMGLCVRSGPSPPTEKGESPQFSADVYCGQTAAWTKMSLGTEVGLGPDDIVLDGDPAPPPEKEVGAPSPIFGRCLLWPNGLMGQDRTWHGDEPWSRPHCARPSSPP